MEGMMAVDGTRYVQVVENEVKFIIDAWMMLIVDWQEVQGDVVSYGSMYLSCGTREG